MNRQDQLEKDFNEVKDQVNAKLKEAAEAVREAQKVAESKGLSLAYTDDEGYVCYWHPEDEECNLSFNVRQLTKAMDEAGWNSSSWNC